MTSPAFTYSDVVNAYFTLPPEVRPEMHWEATEEALQLLAQVRDRSGRPILSPTSNAPDAEWLLLGKPVDVVSHLDPPGLRLYDPEERAFFIRAFDLLADAPPGPRRDGLEGIISRRIAFMGRVYDRHRRMRFEQAAKFNRALEEDE